MHLNRWKSVLVSWANALEVAPTTLNFIGDLTPQFFISLCSYLKGRDVSTLQESVTYIKGYYKSLILGNEEDENYVALLATAYLIFTSLHQTNDELCKRLCRVSNTEQAQNIKSALEAFVDIQPAKITKELIFMTLAQLPEGSELFENSPYLASPGSSSSNKDTPAKDNETPSCPRSRRSSRFKKVKHQLHMTMTLKNTLQDELESARETISNLESVVVLKNQDIAQLKERCRRLLKESEADKSVSSPCPLTPVNDGRGCIKCKSFERQISAYEEDALQDKSEIQGLNESLATLTKKISKLESEKRTLDGQLQMYEEQILKNNDEISALQNHQRDLMINTKELESIIEELRDARSAADCSIDADVPNNLGSEVIDLQLREMRLALDERDQIICERDNDISNLREKLKELQCERQSAIQEIKRENELCNAKIINLQKDVERLSGECKLVTTRLADAQKTNEDLEQQLQENHKHVTTLYEDLGKQEGELHKYYLLCNEHERVLSMKNEEVSSLENKVLHHTALLRKMYEENQTLAREMETLKSGFEEHSTGLEKELALKEENISTLEKKVEESIESLKQQSEAFTGLKEECDTLQSSLTEKTAEISLLKVEISQNQSSILGIEQENDLCKAKILSLQNDLERSSADYKLATTKLDESQKTKECLEQQVEDSQQCITSLTEDLERQGEELRKLVLSYNQQEKVLAKNKETISSLENEVVHITAVVLQEKALKEALAQEMKTQKLRFEERCNELERQVALKEVSIATLEKEAEESIETLQRQVEAFTVLNEEYKTLQSCLTGKTAEISLLKNEISQNQSAIVGMQQENELLNAKVLTSHHEIERLKNEYELATEQLADVRKNKEDLEHKLQERQQLITSFSEDLEKQGKEWKKLELLYNEQQKALAMRNDHVSSLEKEVVHITAIVQQEKEAKEALVQEMETQRLSFKELHNKLERDVALKEENISSLENYAMKSAESLQQQIEACTGLKEECKTLQSSLTEKKAEISVLKLEISQNQTVILGLQQENDLCKEKILSLQNDLERSSGDYKLATSKLIESQKMMECVEQQVQESQQCITALTKDLQKQGEELRKLVLSYNQQEKVLAKNKETISSLENEVAHVTAVVLQEKQLKEAVVQEMKAQKLGFEERCNELERQVALKEVSISTLEKKAEESRESLQQQVEAFTVLNEEYKTLQSCLTGKTAEISLLKNEISQNQSAIVGMQQENELLNAKVLTSHNEIERLKSEYELATEQLANVRKNEEDLEHKLQERQQLITSFSEDLERQGKEWQKLELLYNEQEKVLAMRNNQISSLEEEVVHITAVAHQENEAKETLIQEIETQRLGFEEFHNKLEREVALKEENISSLENYAQKSAESLQQHMVACTRLKEECETLQSSLTEKNTEISVLQTEISQNQTAILGMQQQNDLCEAKIISLQNDVERLSGDYKLATTQCVDSQKMKECLELQVQESQQCITSLTEDLEKQGEELRKLVLSYNEQKEVLAMKNEKLSSLENEVVHITAVVLLEKELKEALVQEMKTQKLGFEERCNELEREVALKEVSIATLEKKAEESVESLQQQLEAFNDLNEECKTLQSCLTEKTAEISQKQSVFVGIQQENELLNAKILSSLNEIERLKTDYKLATEQLAGVQEIKEDLELELQEREQRITSFSEDLEKHGKEWKKLELLYNEQQKALAMRNDHISSLEKEVVHITAVVQQEKEAKEALVQEMETQRLGYEEICNKLERDVAVKEENISSLENYAMKSAETLQQQIEACTGLKEECQTWQSSLTEKNAGISVLKLEISQNQTVILELQQENDLCKEKIRTLDGNIEKLTGDFKHATSQLFDVRKEKEGIEQLLQESHQRLTTVCEKLDRREEELLKIDALYKEQEKELTVKVDQLSSLKKEVVRYESVKREMEQENLKRKERNDALEAEVSKLAQSNDVTDAKLLKILEQKNILEERLTTLEKQLKEKVCNEEKLQQSVIALQTALDTEKALTSTIEEDKRCLESLKLEIELEKANTRPVIRSLQAEVERLTNENKSATSLASSLKCETESLNRRLENYSLDLDIKNETVLMMEATLCSLNSKVGLLEATIIDKDSLITAAKMDLHNTEAAFEKYREESQRHQDSRREELVDLLVQKKDELGDLEERIANMAEELVHVSQTFNVEKTSLIDHAKNLEEMLEKSTAAEEQLQDKVRLISNQLADAEKKVSHLDEKLSLTVEFHTCEKRELTTKNQFFKTQMDEYKLKCERLIKEIEDNHLEEIKEKSSRLETENQDLRNKLELKTRDIEWYTHEMGLLNNINDKNMRVINQLDEENKNLIQSKKEVVDRLEKEIALLKQENKRLDPHATDISAMLRQEYEEKLEKLKAKMRKVYTEKVEAMMKFQTGEEKMYADEELKRAKQKRNSLEAKVRELSDQILILQEEKRALISNHIFRTPAYPHGGPISNPAYESPPMLKTHSLDRLPITSHGLDNLGADLSLDQSYSSRRTSTSSNRSNHLPKGIGKVFPAAEEEGEVFDNRCLSDLKEGICKLPSGSGGVDRMSILQQRNSMCPPHLKSSYPVESQFFAPNSKEDEIKVITKGNKENVSEGSRSVAGTPSKLRSLFSGRRKH